MSTASNYRPQIEPITRQYLDDLAELGLPPIFTLTPAAARKALADAQREPVALPEAQIEERTLEVGPTGKTRVHIVRPANTKVNLPVLMYFHGGGWMLGDFGTHERLVRDLAVQSGAVVVFVDYDRSPEARYPVANEQAYAATLYVHDHAGEFGADATRIAVAGDSAGGNMATAVTLLATGRGGPKLLKQVLFYPVTDVDFDTPSYREFGDGPWLTLMAMKWYWDNYLPDTAARTAPTVSPLRASLEQLAGLPPALIITAENDVLRDEGEAYARKLAQAGVSVTAVRYLGVIHDFVLINELAGVPAAQSAIDLAASTLRQAFLNAALTARH